MSREAVVEAIKVLRSGGYRTPPPLWPQASDDEMRAFMVTWADELGGTAPEGTDPMEYHRERDEFLNMAAREWVRSADHFPTLAEFVEGIRAVVRRNRPLGKQLEETTGNAKDVTPLPEAKKRLAELREQIAKSEGPFFHKDGTGESVAVL